MIVEPHVEEVIQGNPHTARDVDLGIDHDEEMFLLSVTGIETVDQLQSHILRIQGDAEKVFLFHVLRNGEIRHLFHRYFHTPVSGDSIS